MTLRHVSGPLGAVLARQWPKLAEELAAMRLPESPICHVPQPPKPKRDQSGAPRTKESMADRIATLAVGERRTVWSFNRPDTYVKGAHKINGGQYVITKGAEENAWIVGRVA